MNQSQSMLSSLNINTREDINEFLLISLKWTKFAETHFKNPDDSDLPLRLEPVQTKTINALQFGYDIDAVPYNYTVKSPPKIVVLICPRQFGKSVGVSAGVGTILAIQPGMKIGVMGMSEESAKLLIDKTRFFIENSPYKIHLKKSLKMELIMDHGGFMKAFATSHGIRGQSFHYVLLDECAQIDDEIIEGAALDTARKIGRRVIMLSTPKGYGGILVRYYLQGLKTRTVICKKCFTEFTQAHFKVNFGPIFMPKGLPPCSECGFYLEDSPPKSNPDIKVGKTYFYGIGHYTVVPVDPFTSTFYPKEKVLEELRMRGNTPTARQELLGEIIAEGSGVFRKEWIDKCTDTALENIFTKDEKCSYMLGIDFGKSHDNSVACIGHEDSKTGNVILDYIKIIRSDDIEYEDIKNDLIEIVAYFKPIWILADATGMGEPVIEWMEKDLIQIGWQGRIYCNKDKHLGFIFDAKSKPDLIENLVEYFARGRIRIPPKYDGDMSDLHEELLAFSYDVSKANYIKYGVQTSHDDTVIALALMTWGHKQKPWAPLLASFAEPRGEML